MISFRIKLLLAILFIIPLSNAGVISSLIKNNKIKTMTKLLNKEQTNYLRLIQLIELKQIIKKPEMNFKDKLVSIDKEIFLDNNSFKINLIDSNSFRIIESLRLLSTEEILLHMNKLASTLKIQPPDTEVREIALAFTFFLESGESGEPLQQNLVKSIIDLSRSEHYYSSINNPSLKNTKIVIPWQYWTLVMQRITPEKTLDWTIFFKEMNIQMLQERSELLFGLYFESLRK